MEFQGLARLYVRAGATGTNSGESWANALTDLQAALADGTVRWAGISAMLHDLAHTGASDTTALRQLAKWGSLL
jgi:hypothetical protein